MTKDRFEIKTIGYVRAGDNGFYLEIDEEYSSGLLDLENFSHINVLWWCNLVDEEQYRRILTCEKPYKKGPDKIGIFATRSPMRPNPIAITTVAVIRIDKSGKIYIPYIDAEGGSPIIDIKPYHPSEDRLREVKVPDWCRHWPQWSEDSANFNWEEEFNFPG